MKNKYLPIGSVCTLNGKNKKMMIIGYYSVEFNGNFKINDYLGCVYPEGMLLPNQTFTFNHKDIEKVDFVGYKNGDFNIFMRIFDKLTGNNKNDLNEIIQTHKENDMVLTSSKAYSKLLFDENGVVMIAEPVKEVSRNQATEVDNIKFDENGTVISMKKIEEVNNPFYRNIEVDVKKEEHNSANWNIFNNIKFDENGTVISVNNDIDNKKGQMLNKIEFDENGVVISANNNIDNEKKQTSNKIEFDKNGVVVAVNSSDKKIAKVPQTEQNKLNIKFDESETIIGT